MSCFCTSGTEPLWLSKALLFVQPCWQSLLLITIHFSLKLLQIILYFCCLKFKMYYSIYTTGFFFFFARPQPILNTVPKISVSHASPGCDGNWKAAWRLQFQLPLRRRSVRVQVWMEAASQKSQRSPRPPLWPEVKLFSIALFSFTLYTRYLT